MHNALMTKLLVIAMSSIALAGCVDENIDSFEPISGVAIDSLLAGDSLLVSSTFTESLVDVAVDRAGSLYEPTIDVCDDGSIYITGHTAAVDTTGAPVFGSHNDGETWVQLPWFQENSLPGRQVPGSTPPVTDEIFLTCGEDGWLYGADITAFAFPVNAWSEYGTAHSYYNPNAYDRTSSISSVCGAAGLNDRPWAAYANGKLLMVNNPGGGSAPLGRVEVGVMDVPVDEPVGVGNPVNGPEWNHCATVGGSIPGIPDMRDDHVFAAPQIQGGKLVAVIGNANSIQDTEVVDLFNFTSLGEITSRYGHAVFDGAGDLFIGVTNNTRETTCETVPDVAGNPDDSCTTTAVDGGFIITASQDGGETFEQTNFTFEGKPIVNFYLDGHKAGTGALVVFTVRDDETGFDWYTGHLAIGEDGAPVLTQVGLAIDNGLEPSAHVTGAAVGPDGRAYLAMYNGGGSAQAPAYALSVYIQRDGPVLPVAAAEAIPAQ